MKTSCSLETNFRGYYPALFALDAWLVKTCSSNKLTRPILTIHVKAWKHHLASFYNV
jgi:hypothetical protein